MSINLNRSRSATFITNLLVVIICALTIANASVSAQVVAPLEVTLTVSPITFPESQQAVALVKLKNVSASPIVIPAIGAAAQDKYFTLEVTHSSGISIFFISPAFSIRPSRLAGATIRLYPNQQISFNLIINEFGSGFWGYEKPNTPSSIRTYKGNFNVRAKFMVDDGNLPTSGDLTNVFRGTVFSAAATINVTPPLPSLITEANSTRAIALDSVTFVRDPFPVSTGKNFSSDQRTRVMLIASDIATADFSSVTAQVEDSQQRVFPLTVEYVGKIPNFGWLMQVIVRLPDELANDGDVQVSINVRGTVTNKALISIRPPQ
jgi:hypothetical protein